MNDRIKVLMVDDDAQFRQTTHKILTRRGFDTVMAESGQAAIRKLDENPDVVILDIKMPGMDGHQTLREIRKHKPGLPVIMLTGHGDMASAKEAWEEGAFDYLSKPCDIDLLTSKIRDATRKGAAKAAYKENDVSGVMIPISDYTTVAPEMTVRDAIFELKKSFATKMSTSKIMETGHRSVLVVDSHSAVIGIVAITDMLEMILPEYLSAPKPSTADSIQYSPLFWKGLFLQQVRRKAAMRIKDVMAPVPFTISAGASLMEAVFMMLQHGVRRLLVEDKGRTVGIIREQDLFFEMEKVLR